MSSEHNLSAAAGLVVASAVQNTRNLFCPYCAECFLFEFTLKDHLKAQHRNDIAKLLANGDGDNDTDFLSLSMQQCQHYCPFCSAAFNSFVLIPKHIFDYHGCELLQLWQRQSGNVERLQAAKALHATCSPGLSEIFRGMETTDDDDASSSRATNTVPEITGACHHTKSLQLKSILKKTPSKRTSVVGPQTPNLKPGVTIRRSKSDVVKRSLSVRRELRFDPSTKSTVVSPCSRRGATEAVSPRVHNKKGAFRMLSIPFSGVLRKMQTARKPATASNRLITSTPIGLLDDHDPNDHNAAGATGSDVQHAHHNQLANWKASKRHVAAASPSHKHHHAHRTESADQPPAAPYQCAHCKRAYASNADLLLHLHGHHRGIRHWFRPQFGCTTCGSRFYSNTHLIRHCREQHGNNDGEGDGPRVRAGGKALTRRHSMR